MKRLIPLALTSLLALSVATLPVQAATTYTGDRVDGAPVIDQLDIADLPAGQTTRLWFRVSDQAIGQGWYVPVIVIKGAKPGARLLLTAGIHGDELNGLAVIDRLVAETDPATLSGSIVTIPGLNSPGLLHSTRAFSSTGGTGGANLNRLMPGNPHGSPSDLYASRLWSKLFIGNADLAVDLHTQSQGSTYPMYIFAETGGARAMADLIGADVINMDPGVDGAVENMLNAHGFSAITLELGGAETFDAAMIERGVKGLRNLMRAHAMIPGKAEALKTGFVGNTTLDVTSPRGGYAYLKVRLGDTVKAGDLLATVHDGLGRETGRVLAPHDGQVLSHITDPRVEPGQMTVRLIWWDAKGVCAQTGCPPKK